MNRLDTVTRSRVLACLVEGCSVASACRMVGVSKSAVLKLAADLGEACSDYQDKVLRELNTVRVQCDEVWSFVHCKDKNKPKRLKDDPNYGSRWTWTAIDADSKLMITYFVGSRDAHSACRFMLDVASRLRNRVQLTTDAHHAYLEAVGLSFDQIDYAMLLKKYGPGPLDAGRYSPPVCTGIESRPIRGEPTPGSFARNVAG